MYRQIYEGMEAAQGEGKIPSDVDIEVVWEGLLLGYPDQAIWDFEQARRKGDMGRLVETDWLSTVPAGFNKGAHPTFSYYPEHEDDSEIQAYIQKARQVLESFYSVPEIRDLMGL